MYDHFFEKIIQYITSRISVLFLVVLAMAGVLVYRCYHLQIIEGADYLASFLSSTEKTIELTGARGNIYDRNGNLLAYNTLAYSVKIEDVFETGSSKNATVNAVIYNLIGLIEKNGDSVDADFYIYIDEDGNFAYNVEGTSLLRFLADVFGYSSTGSLSDEEKAMTATEMMEYLSRAKGSGTCFAIGAYEVEGDSTTDFIPGKGYTKEDWLKMVTIRYNMSLTSYQKYLGTTVATDVSEETVAVIMENADVLTGVSVEEDTVRCYVDSEYFAHILGYTGKISSAALETLNAQVVEEGGAEDTYSINDVVGKSGIELTMETTLQGTKGYEKVIVDTTGQVISVEERVEATAGNDVYLTIDKDLTIASYNIVEQMLAGILVAKLQNIKEYDTSSSTDTSAIPVCIYDVYYAFFNNNILDTDHFAAEDAGETEAAVYALHEAYAQAVYEKMRTELLTTQTIYSKLTKEYQVYQSNIVSQLKSNGILIKDMIDDTDATQIAWATDEVISLSEYLEYCIRMNWVDVTALTVKGDYADTTEIFESLVDYIIEMMENSSDFQTRFYKYMLLNDVLTGKQVCFLVCEQGCINVSAEDKAALYAGTITAYQFMKNRISNLDVTPAQLALDPCNASVVITDVNTGEVLAMVSYPGYDNNKMANTVDATYYASLLADNSSPLYNFATQNKAAPGSTFKMVSAAAALMEGVVSVAEKINCLGTFTALTTMSPKCWNTYGHGNETLVTAIRDSCNYYFYEVGYRLASTSDGYDSNAGLEKLAYYADLFGLSEKSGVEITEETPEVSSTDPVRSAIGQGSHSYTTVGLARYVTTIANSGTCYNLTLLDKVTDSEGNLLVDYSADVRNLVDLPSSYWTSVHEGMRLVVQNKSYFSDLAVEVAGKTGTAQQSTSRPSHALFVSYAPADDPEISVTVRIPYGYSSDYAAQVARNIYSYYYGLAEEEDLLTGTADSPITTTSDEV